MFRVFNSRHAYVAAAVPQGGHVRELGVEPAKDTEATGWGRGRHRDEVICHWGICLP